ncbi:MAG TPA: hemerythrin domain-containing protein, partial [Candidatus Acidoferrales bacterium]
MTSAPQPARSLSVEYLLHDHTECDALMRELEALLEKQNAAPQWTAEYSATYRRICGFFRETVIGHIRREEEVLYKALEEFLPRDT